MKEMAILFACCMAYSIAVKQGWMAPWPSLEREAPWWVSALIAVLLLMAVFDVFRLVFWRRRLKEKGRG